MIATMRGWWLVLATACGSDATPLDTAVSGDRLKIARVEFVDGLETWASVPAGEPDLFDVTLGRACVPRTWSDGIARCTPELAPLVYLDANCSEPHVASGPPRFAADPSPLPVELFFSTTTTIVPAELFEQRDGRCVPAPSAALVSPVEPRSLSELVELSTELLGDPPLVVATLRGADGLIVPAGLHDTRTATTCDLAALEGRRSGRAPRTRAT